MNQPSIEEMRALANNLLSAPEQCVPWTPIPERFSRTWQVDVTHFAEDYGEDQQPGENLTVALAAYVEPLDITPIDSGAWRIDFTGCQAYRQRIVGYVGSLPLTRPDTDVACWEIRRSHYLVESGVWSGHFSRRFEFRHYVIVSAIHTVHEVLARGWRCTPLPDEWLRTFSGPMPPWPPVSQ